MCTEPDPKSASVLHSYKLSIYLPMFSYISLPSHLSTHILLHEKLGALALYTLAARVPWVYSLHDIQSQSLPSSP